MSGALLAFDNVVAGFGALRAVNGVSTTFGPGGVHAVLGAAGAGKSTLLRSVNRLIELEPDAWRRGAVTLDGIEVHAIDVQVLRRSCGYLFDRPTALPGSVADNIGFSLALRGITGRDREARVEEALRRAGLADEVTFDHPASSLSAGQLQLLGIARILAARPRILLVDEPTILLHPAEAARLERVLSALGDEITIVWATRETALAGRVAGRVAVMHGGKVVEVGAVDEVFMTPQQPETQAYLARRF